jgi:hypothetical protein
MNEPNPSYIGSQDSLLNAMVSDSIELAVVVKDIILLSVGNILVFFKERN